MANINIDVNEGREPITINGDKDRVIYVNTSDFNILVRANKVRKTIRDRQSIEIEEPNADDIESISTYLDLMDKENQFYRKQVDYIFNENVSDIVFGNFEPTTQLKNGDTMINVFIEAIIPEIAKSIEKAQKKSEERISKYTAKYNKG